MTAGLLVAAPRSGGGKTTVTLGLLAALRRRGLAVAAVKAGPDYIDTAFHAAATGREGCNLDSWAMPPDLLDSLMVRAADGADLVLVEGAMGLFDGIEGPAGRRGSAADLCARFRLKALLVLDVSGQAQTAAAVLRGMAMHDPATQIAGVVLNRIGSDRHRRMIETAIAPLGIPVVGAIPRGAAPVLPERHLGLVQAEEHAALPDMLAALADMAERCLDVGAVIGMATIGEAGASGRCTASAAPPSLMPLDACASIAGSAAAPAPPGQRIALARDAAFSFLYGHVLSGWRAAGAEIVPFSPLADEGPDEAADCCWLPGGYPELHAGRLASARRFLGGLRAFAATRPVHGECGGYMVLGATLQDTAGETHRMAGLLGHATSFARRKLHLGYREVRLLAPGSLGPPGTCLRGHEFHYATLIDDGGDTSLATQWDGEGRDLGPGGTCRGRVSGTFFHVIARTEQPF